MKKFLAVLLVLAVACSLVTVAMADDYSTDAAIENAKATYGQTDNNNFWYVGNTPTTDSVYAYLDNKVLHFVGQGATKGFNDQGTPWFSLLDGNEASESGVAVIYGEGITYVGSRHVSKCNAVTSVSFPSSLSGISSTFANYATNLETVTFAEGCKTTTLGTYWGCTSLTAIEIPASVKSIDCGAFFGCSSLASVVFEEGSQLASIGDMSNGNGTFEGCTSLTSIVIPNTVKTLGQAVFKDTKLTTVTIPANVEEMGKMCFQGCDQLSQVVFETNKIKLIDENTFQNCSSLISVNIPDSVEKITKRAFQGCSSLTTLTFGENSHLKEISGFATFTGCTSLGELDLPASVEVIDSNTFYAYESMSAATNVKIDFSKLPNLKTIGQTAFKGCNQLGPVVRFPASLTAVGNSAFEGENSGIRVADFSHTGNNCTIGNMAFYNWQTMFYLADPDGDVYTQTRKRALAYTNGGVIPFEQTIDPDKLATPVKQGYVFVGWYTDKGLNTEAAHTGSGDNKVYAVTNNTTYYAKWEKATYTPQAPNALDFGTVTYGYTAPAAQSVTFTTNDSVPSIKSVSGSASFDAAIDGLKVTVTPKTGRGVATHSEEISVVLGNGDTVKIPATMKVTPAPLTATYAGETIKKGRTPELKVTVTGFVNGETDAVLTAKPTLSGDYDVNTVGEYTLTPEGGAAANYEFATYTPGVLKVERRSYGGSYTPTTDKKVESPKTFDAGIAVYGVMALASAAGAVYVTKKHH